MDRTGQITPGPDVVAVLVAGVRPEGATSAVEPVEQSDDEHAAGRRAAARAVAALGAAGEVSGGRGARPSWPSGLVGSISHTQRWAAAVTAHSARHQAVGLDLEVAGALPAEDAVVVCSAAERSVLTGLPAGARRDAVATVLWAAKEAAFKAWDPWCDGALQGVDPALLAVDLGEHGHVHVHPAGALTGRVEGLPPLSGRWADAAGLLAVALAAPCEPAPSAATRCDRLVPTGRSAPRRTHR